MSSFVVYRDGGKTSEEGLYKAISRLLVQGNPTITTATSQQVVQHGGGANMSVDVSIGDSMLPNTAGTYSYTGWIDAVANVAIGTADPTNPRIDVIVAWVDLSVVNNASNNNPGALKFMDVQGVAAGSPSAPSGSTIQAAVGAGNPYQILSQVAVAANATQIVTANITDKRQPYAVRARLWGGASNTNGHIVPNIADDTVALLAAAQTISNKTFDNTNTIITNGWQSQTDNPNTIVYNGNRSYTCTFNGVDKTGIWSPGLRLRTTRTVAAPTQCTSLNGTTQFWNNTSPNKLTFTNFPVGGVWIKLTSYATGSIESRYNGTSGWDFQINASGQIVLIGYNGGAANFNSVTSYQSVPLNKWVHVSAELDMSTATLDGTHSWIMIDGVDVPAFKTSGGTNPTSLIQAGNLEVGSRNAGTQPFPGKLAQVAIFSAAVTQATMRGYISQGYGGTETSLASAYSFSNSVNDLNTTTPNNLTTNGAAAATNADSPFGGQAGGSISSTLDYGIITSVSFSTNTTVVVQVPEGCTIPTSGGVSAVSYSTVGVPYGFPKQRSKWAIMAYVKTSVSIGTVAGTWYAGNVLTLNIPVGSWSVNYNINHATDKTANDYRVPSATLSTSSSAETDAFWTSKMQVGVLGAGTVDSEWTVDHLKTGYIDVVALTPYYGLVMEGQTMTSQALGANSVITAECAHL